MPQLFLDALDARNVELSTFCVMVVDECQHCSGRHPFAKIFREHYSQLRPRGQIRVLGLSEQLVKRKVKGAMERQQAIKKLENAMDSHKIDLSHVLETSAKTHSHAAIDSGAASTVTGGSAAGYPTAALATEMESKTPLANGEQLRSERGGYSAHVLAYESQHSGVVTARSDGGDCEHDDKKK